eukprot:6199833-Pleurochrysis_carterae.AAC.6
MLAIRITQNQKQNNSAARRTRIVRSMPECPGFVSQEGQHRKHTQIVPVRPGLLPRPAWASAALQSVVRPERLSFGPHVLVSSVTGSDVIEAESAPAREPYCSSLESQRRHRARAAWQQQHDSVVRAAQAEETNP